MAEDKERLVLLLEAQTKAFENALKQARSVSDIEADKIERRQRAMTRQVERSMADFQNKMRTGFTSLQRALGVALPVVSLVAFERAARDAVRTLGDIYNVSQRLGVSTDALQTYRFAMVGLGRAASDADSAITAFARAVGQLNTDVGQRAAGALRELGFTEAEMQNLTDVEQALPRIADRIAALGSEAAQAAVAQKLGLESMLPLLQQGSAAFDRAGDAARRMGYVLDRELLRRASETSTLWEQASEAIGVQFRAALVDLAPAFVSLAQGIAAGATALREFLDLFKEIEQRSQRTLEQQLEEQRVTRVRLYERYGARVETGGNPNAGPSNLESRSGRQLRTELQVARDEYARSMQETYRIQLQLARMIYDEPRTPTNITPPDDEAIRRLTAFVEAMQEQARIALHLADVRERFQKLTDDEAEAIRALEADLRQLEAARAQGVITSDAELERLSALRRARYEEAQATRVQAEAQQRFDQIARARDDFTRANETPRQRIAREIAETQKAEGVTLTSDQAAQNIARLREEYRQLAQAEYEASLQGRILQGVIQGQIRSIEDLARAVAAMVLDAAMAEWAGGGGFGDFTARVGERLGIGRRGADAGLEELERAAQAASVALNEGAKTAAQAVGEQLATAAARAATEEAVKSAAVSSAAATQSGAALQVASASAVLTKSLLAAAAAADAGRRGDSGETAARFVKALTFGGSKQSGGPVNPGLAYRVHKDEMIIPTVPSYVIPKGLLGGGPSIQQIDQRTINFTGTSEELEGLKRALAEDRAARRADTLAIVNDARSRRMIR